MQVRINLNMIFTCME